MAPDAATNFMTLFQSFAKFTAAKGTDTTVWVRFAPKVMIDDIGKNIHPNLLYRFDIWSEQVYTSGASTEKRNGTHRPMGPIVIL
jgi:hypothetical protein